MLKIIFYLKTGKANKKGESPIFARITHNQKSTTMATGKSILKERWQFTNNLRNVLKIEKEKIIKHSLDLFQLNIEKKFNEITKESLDVSLQLLKNEFTGKTETKIKEVSIVEILDKHNKYFERKVNGDERSKASLQKYERSKELLIIFMKNNIISKTFHQMRFPVLLYTISNHFLNTKVILKVELGSKTIQ